MPSKYILDKVFKVGTTYRAEEDKAYVIRKVGTNSTTKAQLAVGGAVALELIDLLAKTGAIDTDRFPPLDLGDLFVVVPPKKTFEVVGESGKAARCLGEILEFSPGEVLAPSLSARFLAQMTKYLTYQSGSFSKGTDTAWPDGEENTVINYTAPTGEKHVFSRYGFARIQNLSADHGPGDWALRFSREDKPLDVMEAEMGALGLDLWRAHQVFDTTPYYIPLDLKDMPLELAPGRNLKVKAINISGASKSPGTGTSITVDVYLLDEYAAV